MNETAKPLCKCARYVLTRKGEQKYLSVRYSPSEPKCKCSKDTTNSGGK